MIVTLWPAKSIAGELDENQFAKTHGGEAGGGKWRKSVSWTIGNGNFEGTSGDADKLARALEGWLVEGKIKVRLWEVFELRIGLSVLGPWSAPILWPHANSWDI